MLCSAIIAILARSGSVPQVRLIIVTTHIRFRYFLILFCPSPSEGYAAPLSAAAMRIWAYSQAPVISGEEAHTVTKSATCPLTLHLCRPRSLDLWPLGCLAQGQHLDYLVKKRS